MNKQTKRILQAIAATVDVDDFAEMGDVCDIEASIADHIIKVYEKETGKDLSEDDSSDIYEGISVTYKFKLLL